MIIRKNVAWCVLTYNNPDVIYKVWESNVYKYRDMGIMRNAIMMYTLTQWNFITIGDIWLYR